MSEDRVLLCFYLYKVFLQDGTELPKMKYSATLNDSVGKEYPTHVKDD